MEPRVFVAKRGRVVFGAIAAVICGAMYWPAINGGISLWNEANLLSGRSLLFVVGLLFFLAGWTMRIRTDEEGISSRFFFLKKSVTWSELDYSILYVLVEPDFPLGIKIYRTGEKTAHMTIYLKNYSKDEVSWMIANLPLRCRQKTGRIGARAEMIDPKANNVKRWIIWSAALLLFLVVRRYMK